MLPSSADLDRISRVALGSRSVLKLRAVERVLADVLPAASAEVVTVRTSVAAQPDTDEMTLAGAEERARGALEAAGADLGIGVESGVQRLGSSVYASTWAVVVAWDGRIGAGSSGRVRLPDWLVAELRGGVELHEAIRRATGIEAQGERTGVVGLLTNDRFTRDMAVAEALHLALASLHPPI